MLQLRAPSGCCRKTASVEGSLCQGYLSTGFTRMLVTSKPTRLARIRIWRRNATLQLCFSYSIMPNVVVKLKVALLPVWVALAQAFVIPVTISVLAGLSTIDAHNVFLHSGARKIRTS